MRLDKYLSYALNLTRNEARNIIRNRNIKVNDNIILKTDYSIDEYLDTICYLNQKIDYKNNIYLMLNKPKGYLSATKDDKFPTILDLINKYQKYNLFMAGRLDLDSEGLMILTNDGKFAYNLTSPNHECKKRYYVEIENTIPFTLEDINAFQEGLMIDDGKKNIFKTKLALLEIIDPFKAYITILEGKFHQVKKMCQKVGKTVTYLKRVQIGEIKLDPALKIGEYRLLTDEEIALLKK